MNSRKQTARLTGLFYLALAVTGMLGFLVVQPSLHDPADASVTLANLTSQEGLARLGIALELGIVLSQALAAVWFLMLFRSKSVVAAGAIAAFGMVNAVAILGGAAALTVALAVALDPALAPGGDAAATVQLLYGLRGALWSSGGLFFGLWLIPMGGAVLVSGEMPRPLGYVLVIGGAGYVLSSFATVLLPGSAALAEAVLTAPATLGELWMIGYLLVFGVRASSGEGGPGR